jgi:hypothetical protein
MTNAEIIERIIDLVLFDDIHEAGLERIADKIDLAKLKADDIEAMTRVHVAATLRAMTP